MRYSIGITLFLLAVLHFSTARAYTLLPNGEPVNIAGPYEYNLIYPIPFYVGLNGGPPLPAQPDGNPAHQYGFGVSATINGETAFVCASTNPGPCGASGPTFIFISATSTLVSSVSSSFFSYGYDSTTDSELFLSGNADTFVSVFLELPPGFSIAQITAVPEPSTWAMLLIGFAGIGFAGYRRSRASAFI
jgi:hypothetical protein